MEQTKGFVSCLVGDVVCSDLWRETRRFGTNRAAMLESWRDWREMMKFESNLSQQ